MKPTKRDMERAREICKFVEHWAGAINGKDKGLNKIAEALAAERERAAKIADEMAKNLDNDWNRKISNVDDLINICEDLAEAIRRQGEPK